MIFIIVGAVVCTVVVAVALTVCVVKSCGCERRKKRVPHLSAVIIDRLPPYLLDDEEVAASVKQTSSAPPLQQIDDPSINTSSTWSISSTESGSIPPPYVETVSTIPK